MLPRSGSSGSVCSGTSARQESSPRRAPQAERMRRMRYLRPAGSSAAPNAIAPVCSLQGAVKGRLLLAPSPTTCRAR